MKCQKTIYIQTFDNGKRICLGTLEPTKKRAGSITQEICQGNIEIEISAEDESYYGGSSARLNVEWRCDYCGCSFYPERELPNEYNIGDWINSIVKTLP